MFAVNVVMAKNASSDMTPKKNPSVGVRVTLRNITFIATFLRLIAKFSMVNSPQMEIHRLVYD